MKKLNLFVCLVLIISDTQAQSSKNKEIINDSNDAKSAFLKQDPQMAKFLNSRQKFKFNPFGK